MRSALFLSVIGFVTSFALSPAFGASPSDFYCSETILAHKPLPPPNLQNLSVPVVSAYGTWVKSCDGKTVSEENVCSMVVGCAMIPESVKLQAIANLNKEFSKLTEAQKSGLMANEVALHHVVPTVLTCAGKANGAGGVSCPIPEKCKGDVLFNVQEAVLDDTDGPGNLDRVRSGNPHNFQTNTDSAPSGGAATTSGAATGNQP